VPRCVIPKAFSNFGSSGEHKEQHAEEQQAEEQQAFRGVKPVNMTNNMQKNSRTAVGIMVVDYGEQHAEEQQAYRGYHSGEHEEQRAEEHQAYREY
jgi:hypothetical protein